MSSLVTRKNEKNIDSGNVYYKDKDLGESIREKRKLGKEIILCGFQDDDFKAIFTKHGVSYVSNCCL